MVASDSDAGSVFGRQWLPSNAVPLVVEED